jgi:hypothetical protein
MITGENRGKNARFQHSGMESFSMYFRELASSACRLPAHAQQQEYLFAFAYSAGFACFVALLVSNALLE